jgi:hypothetical protein
MRVVSALRTFEGSVHEAEIVWYDTDRWPSFIDGLERIESVAEAWPQAGAEIRWQSGPAGRGRVVERVVGHEALEGQTVEVEDDSITGRQWVAFAPEDGGVTVTLTLRYELKRRSPVTPLIDFLFIRPAIRGSLEATLHRFGAELQAARVQGVG